MKAKDFETAFDDNVSLVNALDLTSAKRPNLEVKRVNVDFPAWVVDSLDKEAALLGVTRQALIKFWVADRLQ